MSQYPFIFSGEKKYRLQRHIYFWVLWFAFNAIIYSFSPVYKQDDSYLMRLFHSAINAFFYLIPHVFLAYTLMYYVVPAFILKEKYFKAALVTILILMSTAILSTLVGFGILTPLWNNILTESNTNPVAYHSEDFFANLLGGLRGAITIGGFATAIKLMKHHHNIEQQKLKLQQQNVTSQLQILKAQVHPHFLFNTLNNIYAHAQVASPQTPKMVAGLSDLLRHILYECNQPLLPLHKELKMLKDYILLEQVRYNDQLELSIDIPTHDEGLMIAPLLFLPLVENCFKHGTSKMLEQPWVALTISIHGNHLHMKLVNGKTGDTDITSNGIGINNVKTRLQLLYTNRHKLRISNTGEAFIVTLSIELDKSIQKPADEKPAVKYA